MKHVASKSGLSTKSTPEEDLMKQSAVYVLISVTISLVLCQSAVANTKMNCLFVESIGLNPTTHQRGRFSGPTAFHAHALGISQIGQKKIQIDLINPEMSRIIWYGITAPCRRVANEFPIAGSACYDLEFSNHPQPNDGQLVIPTADVKYNSSFEIHSVNTVAVPSHGLIDVTDRYSCLLH